MSEVRDIQALYERIDAIVNSDDPGGSDLVDALVLLVAEREDAAVVKTLRDRAKYHRALAEEYRGVNTTAHTVHLVLAGDYDRVADVFEGPAATRPVVVGGARDGADQ